MVIFCFTLSDFVIQLRALIFFPVNLKDILTPQISFLRIVDEIYYMHGLVLPATWQVLLLLYDHWLEARPVIWIPCRPLLCKVIYSGSQLFKKRPNIGNPLGSLHCPDNLNHLEQNV